MSKESDPPKPKDKFIRDTLSLVSMFLSFKSLMSKESVTPKATPKAASIDRSASSTGTPDVESLANQQKMTQRTKFVGKSTKNKVCWQKINKEQSLLAKNQQRTKFVGK